MLRPLLLPMFFLTVGFGHAGTIYLCHPTHGAPLLTQRPCGKAFFRYTQPSSSVEPAYLRQWMPPIKPATNVPSSEQTNPARNLGAQSVKTAISVASKRYNVPKWLIKSVVQVESGGNSQAISPKGADGVMQLMPATAARYGVHDVFSVRQNVDAGTRYLHHLLHWSKGSVPLALAAYNAGPQAVLHYGGIPPYTQTMRYVPKVLALAAQAYAKETQR